MPYSDRNMNLEEQVALLEKALLRERNAKKRLEEKLDDRAQQQLSENQEFLSSYERASSRQLQLQFLATLTQDLLSDKGLDELLYEFSSKMSKLLENCPTLLIQMDSGEKNSIDVYSAAEPQWQSRAWKRTYQEVANNLLENEESIWHRLEHENADKDDSSSLMSLLTNGTLLYLVLNLTATEQRLMLFDISHFCYSDDFKQTLNTAAQQFTLAIKRRATEIELALNIKVLNDIISQLKATQQQLVHSEKMSSLGQLAAGVAHEINNPIGFITSNLHVLKDYIDIYNKTVDELSCQAGLNQAGSNQVLSDDFEFAKSDIDELLDSCVDGVQRVTDIVASLKTFSRKEQDEFSPLNVNDVVESALKIVWNEFKYHHEIIQLLAPSLPDISGSFGQLQQVFVNLFVNAAHAMKDGGQLTIQSVHRDTHVEVNVHDTGCGMDESVIKHLFEPFYTTKAENEGTGLGLSVSYAIVEKHNAAITVSSESNLGSTFTLRFPVLLE